MTTLTLHLPSTTPAARVREVLDILDLRLRQTPHGELIGVPREAPHAPIAPQAWQQMKTSGFEDWDNAEISEQRNWWEKEQEAEWEAASREEFAGDKPAVLPDLRAMDW